ncbi:MAG: hypothetical protein IEMM0006_1318 [bacterium]|nr:MAG: hypothetical protein IEMM0006_1318 [bacterium]
MASNKTGKTNQIKKADTKKGISKKSQLVQVRKKSLNTLKTNMDMLNNEIEKIQQIRAQFLSNVSHEIKTPLNSILSATLLLQQKQLDGEAKELVEAIHHSGQYLFTLLNDVLDYYKIKSHQLNLDHINFELINEIEEIYDIFLEKARKKNLNLQMHRGANVPDFLIGDPMRLKQILASLLDNAVKFTPPQGNIILNIELVSSKDGIHELLFSVCDTGIGISDEDKNKIWKTFSMGDMSLTRENQGTGIGLALSRQLCHLLGGKIRFESEPEKGSTFTFTVKMEKGNHPAKNHNQHQGIRNILLVEDNLINQKLTQKILINQGFHVDVADNGQMAVRKFRKNSYDLIFMDIQMPVMDGLEATRQIRKQESEDQGEGRVKIIALTANSQQQDKENCLAAGMDDYINKPFNVKKFPLILSSLQQVKY